MPSLLVNLSILLNRPTGISVYARNVLPFFERLDPVIFAQAPISNFKFRKIPPGLSPDFGSRGHIKRLWWLQKEMPRYCQKHRNRLIFSPSPEAPLYAGCRFIVTAHDAIPLRFPGSFPTSLVVYFRHYVSQVLQQAEHVICNSVSTARDMTDFYGVPAHKLTPILLAYDKENFQPCEVPSGNYFLYIGRQNAHKNLARLISAFAQVCRVNSDVELWLVGPADQRYTPALIAQAESLDIARRIRFLDYVAYDRLPLLLGGAIALTLPSLWEGFGLPALEAMACGTPVIASNVASLPEVVGDAAILIDPYNVGELSEAMCMVASSSQLRQQLSLAGTRRASSFSWKQTGQQTVDVVEKFMTA